MTEPGDDEPVPLGFKVVVILAGLYLALRAIQAVGWVLGRIG